jgi:O-antigen/teichoic acid export membrane protein
MATEPAVVPLGRAEGADAEPGRHDEHFATEHLLADLKRRTVSSGFITAAAQAVQFFLTLGSTMALARMLTPRDFGLVAMVTTVFGFLRVFKEAGLSTATVQRAEITHTQVSNLFWINVAVSGLISVGLVLLAPALAWFYREPSLVGITLAMAGTFLLTGSTVQHMALLNRQMRFKAIAGVQIGSMVIGVAVGIIMAWLGFGYWSLVGYQLATPLAACVLAWSSSRWRPQFFVWRGGTRPLLSFGFSLTAGGLICSLARVDSLLIGRFCGPESLGLYSRASALLMRPLEQAITPIEAVFVPTLSRLQAQPERYRRSFLSLFEAVALAGFVVGGLLFALARPLTLVVLGPKWEKVAVIFAAFTVFAIYAPLSTVSTWLFTSQGRGKDWLRASSIGSAVTVCSFLAGLPYGPAGVAIVFSVSSILVLLPIFFYFAGQSGPVTTKDLWSVSLWQFPVWGVVSAVTFAVRTLVPGSSPLYQCLICASLGLLAGAAFTLAYAPSRKVALGMLSIIQDFGRARDGTRRS